MPEAIIDMSKVPSVLALCALSFGSAVFAKTQEEACLLARIKQLAPSSTISEVFEACRFADAAVQPHAAQVHTGLDKPEDRKAARDELNSPFGRRLQSELRSLHEPFALLPHRPNYLLPLTHHKRREPSSSLTAGAHQTTEAHFQMSFKIPLSESPLSGQLIPFFAYTGRAWWQVYDGERSRPFREYNHEPEVVLAMPLQNRDAFGWKLRLLSFGFNHQSNGRSAPMSRSWNRLFAEVHAERNASTWMSAKVWHRLAEKEKLHPDDSAGDDNPDIVRYMGNFELKAGWAQPQGYRLTTSVRSRLGTNGKGSAQLDWSLPIKHTQGLRWYVQGFSGYGDSLIDYNQKINRLGFGIMLNDWF